MVTTPEDALSDRRRGILVEEATAAIRETFGIADEDALKVWVLCREIDEGSWGAGGQVIRYKELVEIAKAQRQETTEVAG